MVVENSLFKKKKPNYCNAMRMRALPCSLARLPSRATTVGIELSVLSDVMLTMALVVVGELPVMLRATPIVHAIGRDGL